MFNRYFVLIAGVVAATAVLAGSSHAAATGNWSLTRSNRLTFTHAVALPGVTLSAGTYVFEAGPGGTNPAIVRVVSANGQKMLYLGFTIPVSRPATRPNQLVTFGEARPGEPSPIVAWYPVGSDRGHEFVYR